MMTRFSLARLLSLGASSVLLPIAFVTQSAEAQSTLPQPPTPTAEETAVAEAAYEEDYANYSQVLDQVTSINQFRDVSPTEWSYEALKNLVRCEKWIDCFVYKNDGKQEFTFHRPGKAKSRLDRFYVSEDLAHQLVEVQPQRDMEINGEALWKSFGTIFNSLTPT